MNTPSLTRVKIFKFMLSRIDELLSFDDITKGSHSNHKKVFDELLGLVKLRMISAKVNGYKLTFANAEFIVKNHTELAIICDFSKAIKSKMKEIEKQIKK